MRGEHCQCVGLVLLLKGSSPHARGTPANTLRQRTVNGIIPACAGNTSVAVCAAGNTRDHPRMRGEHAGLVCFVVGRWGSSPHARGTQPAGRIQYDSKGIIPACAGNTLLLSVSTSSTEDHPRMRGEHTPITDMHEVGEGSSPHARGTPVLPFG